MSTIDRVPAQERLSTATSLDLNPPRTVKQAGEQFESLMIAELLRMTHGTDGSWLGSGEDSSSSAAMGVAEESLAQALASQGGFGIGELVTKSLTVLTRGKS